MTDDSRTRSARHRASKLKAEQQAALIASFIESRAILETAQKTGVNKNSVSLYFDKLRYAIFESLPKSSSIYSGIFSLPDNFFENNNDWLRRPKGHSARPAIGVKIIRGRAVAFILSSDKSGKPVTDDIDGIVYSFSSEKSSANKYGLVMSLKTMRNKEKHSKTVALYDEISKIVCASNGISIKKLELYIKQCEWIANTKKFELKYQLTSFARRFISPEIKRVPRPQPTIANIPNIKQLIKSWSKAKADN